MSWKLRIVFACLGLAGMVVLFWYKNHSVSASARTPIVLTVMGKAADTNDFAEQKAFQDFSARTGIQVRFAQSLQTVNERIDLFAGLLRKRSPEPDLIDMDVIWPATLARYLVDLTPYFKEELQDFAPELIANFTVNGRLIAIPTFVDAGVLYYRPDLLRKYGFSAPPKTWDELERTAARIQAGERRHGQPDFWGYVWEGGAYESLTCNALEWQASSGGGTIIEPSGQVRVKNPQFLRALKRAVGWIGTISPPGQSAFNEEDAVNFFGAGKAAFMRSWTGEYSSLSRTPGPVRDHIAVAPLPGGEGGGRGTLGGSGTGVSLYSAHLNEAVQALKAVVSEATQKDRAARGGYIPSRVAIRALPEVMAKTSLHGNVADGVIKNLVARPALQTGGSYQLVSRAYYTAVHSILARKVSPEEGLENLEAELVKITGFKPYP